MGSATKYEHSSSFSQLWAVYKFSCYNPQNSRMCVCVCVATQGPNPYRMCATHFQPCTAKQHPSTSMSMWTLVQLEHCHPPWPWVVFNPVCLFMFMLILQISVTFFWHINCNCIIHNHLHINKPRTCTVFSCDLCFYLLHPLSKPPPLHPRCHVSFIIGPSLHHTTLIHIWGRSRSLGKCVTSAPFKTIPPTFNINVSSHV